MTLIFTYIFFVLMPMILNQVYVDATNGLECIQCDDFRRERFCRESTRTLSFKHLKANDITKRCIGIQTKKDPQNIKLNYDQKEGEHTFLVVFKELINICKEVCYKSYDNGHSQFTAFTVTLNRNSIIWKKGDILKFTRVLTNIGNTYNVYTGIFTVATDGVYAVSAAMIGGKGQSTHVSLRKNGQVMVWLFTGPQFDMAAQTINLALRKGDRLWLRMEAHRVHIFHIVHPYHQLSAVLIKPGKF